MMKRQLDDRHAWSRLAIRNYERFANEEATERLVALIEERGSYKPPAYFGEKPCEPSITRIYAAPPPPDPRFVVKRTGKTTGCVLAFATGIQITDDLPLSQACAEVKRLNLALKGLH